MSELISALAGEGVQCEIATTRGHRVGDDPIAPPDVPIHIFDSGLPARIWTSYSSAMAQFLDENIARFDLVHVHEIWHYACYAAFRAAVRNGIPVVLTPHGELDEWRLRHKAWKKRIYVKAILDRILRNVDTLHAITSAEKDRIASLGYETLVTVAPNGINPPHFDNLPDPSDSLDRFPGLKGKQIILYLGRLNPTKGLDILARAFSAISSRLPDTVLLVAGPDEEGGRQLMESILKSERAPDKVVFTGMLSGEDKMATLALADLFVLPSYSEGFSIAVLEALASRLPVVITKACNFPEVEEHGAGFVVDPNPESITSAIRELLSDPDLRVRMGKNGRKLVTEHFTWQATASKIADLYRTLVDKKKMESTK